ncbi:M15 family metallopeptidase [Marasmitruncus massiliensis]|uniref:M15 family metallopeptidase n=1 Tax=Marasmitruncus massiliensis TaxID=1944642 RepID=UPI000C7973D1|nr:M15 family metallopeptidase [Marasmitruncus massiliensis]
MSIKYGFIAVAAVALTATAAVLVQKNVNWQDILTARSLPETSQSVQESPSEAFSSELASVPDKEFSAGGESQTSGQSETEEASKTPVQTEEEWQLILVNSDHAIDQSFKPELSEVQNGYLMDKRVVGNAQRMIQDAREQGVELLVCSGYRSYESQQQHFDSSVQSLKNSGYTEAAAIASTQQLIARPGTSEHQTGLALDIVTPSYQGLDDGYAETDAAKWLLKHAAEYGFILRYPKDKEEITKISFEPWHYRYVGKQAATEIMEEGICLEEYFEK